MPEHNGGHFTNTILHEEKFLNFKWMKFHKTHSNWQQVRIGQGNGLVPEKSRDINWNNMASLGYNELMLTLWTMKKLIVKIQQKYQEMNEIYWHVKL